MKFYKYIHGIIIEVMEPTEQDDPNTFLVYAENKGQAYLLAMEHLHQKTPLTSFFGIYNDISYYGNIQCVI